MFSNTSLRQCGGLLIVTSTFNLIMAVFDVGQHIITNSAGVIAGNTNIDISSALTNLRTTLEAMENGRTVLAYAGNCPRKPVYEDSSVCITVVIFGRMIEIYLYSSVGAIPFATMANREWGPDRKQLSERACSSRISGLLYYGMRWNICSAC